MTVCTAYTRGRISLDGSNQRASRLCSWLPVQRSACHVDSPPGGSDICPGISVMSFCRSPSFAFAMCGPLSFWVRKEIAYAGMAQAQQSTLQNYQDKGCMCAGTWPASIYPKRANSLWSSDVAGSKDNPERESSSVAVNIFASEQKRYCPV